MRLRDTSTEIEPPRGKLRNLEAVWRKSPQIDVGRVFPRLGGWPDVLLASRRKVSPSWTLRLPIAIIPAVVWPLNSTTGRWGGAPESCGPHSFQKGPTQLLPLSSVPHVRPHTSRMSDWRERGGASPRSTS